MNLRRTSSVTTVGQVRIGGSNPIALQTMINTPTTDVAATVSQLRLLAAAKADVIRLTIQGLAEVEALKEIVKTLKSDGFSVPLVADIHFNAEIAEMVVPLCDKVRINPGNYVHPLKEALKEGYSPALYDEELRLTEERLSKLIALCKTYGTALRIGVNHGSLSERIKYRFGDTTEGIVESCMEYLRICKKYDFSELILSVKASNTQVMVGATTALVRQMDREDMHFPLHLGVTEAGMGEDGRIKSAVGIGALLLQGIGDTIRVSLSENPEREIPIAKKIVESIEECRAIISKLNIDKCKTIIALDEDDAEDLMIRASMIAGYLLLTHQTDDVAIKNHNTDCKNLSDSILQAARIKFTKTEYISCPSCGRTHYDLQLTIEKIRKALNEAALSNPRINTLKIAIMGCIVNGPGEMADADYGFVGQSRGQIALYRGKERIKSSIPQEKAVEELLALIDQDSEKPSDKSSIF